jgi:succinoglycan biosynthesis transport protein ExoP
VGLLGAGLIVGLILGVGAAILRELLDRRVRDDAEAEQVAGAPVLADIPYDSRAAERPLVVISDPDSPEAESYRRLRTNLRVPTLDRNQRSLLVTSPVSGDGKTLIAANLGFVFAQAGHRAVLIDGDLRNPALGRLLGLDPAPGLSEVLSDAGPDLPLRKARELPLETLAAGSPPSNPSDLLESEDFRALLDRLRDRADIVIVDSPALLPVSDAAVMSRAIDGVLLVVRASSTRAEQLDSAADSVRSLGKQPIGVVLNAVRARTGRDYIYAAGGETNAPASTAPDWKV